MPKMQSTNPGKGYELIGQVEENMRMKRLENISLKDFYSEKHTDSKTKRLFELFLEISEIANKEKKLLLAQAGFAVGLAVGKVTRNHRDIDMLTFKKDIGWFKEYFASSGCKIDSYGDPEYSFFFVRDDLHGDLGCIKIEGQKVFDRDDKEWWQWPIMADELIWSREIDGTLVKFVSPVLTYDFKKRQRRRDKKRIKELHDFRVLEKRFPFLKNYKIK